MLNMEFNLRLADDITFDSIVDGEGIRAVIWAQGCSHNCPNCHNPQTHSYQCGKLVSIQSIVDKLASNPLNMGVTFSGGEPFDQSEAFYVLAQELIVHGYNLWAYTGYTFEKLVTNPQHLKLIKCLDVLVDGRYEEELKDITLNYCGSSNQRVIDVVKTLEKREVIVYE